MKGILYNMDNQVVAIIPDVVSIQENNIEGKNAAARGVGHAFRVVDDSVTVEVGDTIDPAQLIDQRDKLPKTSDQLKDEKIARLEAEKAALEQKLGQLNADFVGFTDFYFEKNPTQA